MNFKNSFVCSSLFCLVKITPPRIFDSNNLGTPSIQVISGEQAVAVSLLCKVDLLQGIEQRDDVEYKIEWTSEGKTLRIKSRCDQKDRIPCPNTNSIVSTLIGFTDYLAGIWVMYFVSLFFLFGPENRKLYFGGVNGFKRIRVVRLEQECNRVTIWR